MTICEELRQAVLQAAIQGKLTEQRAEDGTAEELLEEIKKEKARLEAEGKIKKEKPLPEINKDEVPFDIPENWKWVRLLDICKSVADGDHMPPPQTSSGVPFIVISNISSGTIDFSNTRFVEREYFSSLSEERVGRKGDVLFSVTGSYGIPIVVDIDTEFCFQRHIALIKPFIEKEFLYEALLSPLVKDQCDRVATGTAQKTVGIKSLKQVLLPLPPLAEQRRIVSAVNTLMTKIDELEKIENELEAMKTAFPGDMRDAILQAAMQGKLTEQLPEDGTAEELLKEIEKEKDRLIKEGKIKKEKPLPEIGEDEIPFDIPENWKWVRLGELGQMIGGGTPKTHVDAYWRNGTIPWITPADMNHEKQYISAGKKMITQEGLDNSSAQIFPRGSIVISSRAPIGYIMIAEKDASTSQGCKTFSAYNQALLISEYVYYLMYFRTPDLVLRASGTTFKEISGKGIGETVVPLPPLTEQHRIVARLNEMLPLCDALEAAR